MKELHILVYNEEVINSFIADSLGSWSILGLYVAVVYAVGAIIRLVFERISQRVVYEEMPYPEKIFEICEGIFIAQQEGDLVKEKLLYTMLIRLYRSPETIIKITGDKLDYSKKEEKKKRMREDSQPERSAFE
mmetsp:Transcript_22704/g.17130  ORF Transcript_22704/g.17130 Transcript_22704/m.17130 type:complete len:133 (+) Transcript_22704:2623-3021(+)